MAFVVRSPAFFVLLGIGVVNSVGGLWLPELWYCAVFIILPPPSWPLLALLLVVMIAAAAWQRR